MIRISRLHRRLPLVIAVVLAAVPLGLVSTRAADPEMDQYVLLIDTHAVLFGRVNEQVDRVTLTRPGSELRLPRGRVACWSPTLGGLYQYLLDHRTEINLYEHLQLARWCIRQQFWAGAERELSSARRLAPDDPELLSVLDQLTRAREEARQKVQNSASREAQDVDASNPANGSSDNHDAEVSEEGSAGFHSSSTNRSGTANSESESDSAPSNRPASRDPQANVDSRITAEVLSSFAADIQPLLNNRCATAACHGKGSRAVFQFQSSPPGSGHPSAEITRENLEAVIAWVDREHAAASPLLVRALQAHGGSPRPPLGPRTREAVDNLRRWVYRVAHQAEQNPQAVGQMAALDGGADAAGDSRAPVPLPNIEDPFDPDLFNRRMHPNRDR